MNSESIIHSVRAHAELYDPSHPNHRNREQISHIWRIIAQELGPNISVDDVRRRWANLRSNYMRERRKLQQSSAVSGDTSAASTWPYYDMLTFLDDSIDQWRMPLNIQQGYEYYEAEPITIETPVVHEIPEESTGTSANVRASNEELINLIRPYEELYDLNHPKHRCREHISQVWKIIGGQLKVTPVEAKKKWANLRSNYNREKRKLNMLYPDGGTPKITWPYFELLSFLETAGEWRKIPVANDTFAPSYESDSLSADYTTEDIIIKTESEVDLEVEPEPYSRKRKAPDCTGIVDTEEMCLSEVDKPGNDDPDYMFLRSLVPMMRMLGPIENLEFRGEVITLLKRKIQLLQATSTIEIHY